MGKKGGWFSVIKRFFTCQSGEDRGNNSGNEKKGGGKGESSSFIPLFRKPSTVEKIFSDFEREQHIVAFRPPTPELPSTPHIPPLAASPQAPSPPRAASPREPSPEISPPTVASSPRAASPREPSPEISPPRVAPPPRAASPREPSPKIFPPPKAASRPQACSSTVVNHPKEVSYIPESTETNHLSSVIKIQAAYRGYVAKKSFRALKGLVRLQGVVRGNNVRRQTLNAKRQMQLLVRVQSQIQSRRIEMLANQRQLQDQPNDIEVQSTFGLSQILEALGAYVERVRPVSITHRDHYVNIARRRAAEANELALKHKKEEQLCVKDEEQINGPIYEGETQDSFFSRNCDGGFFADQFENLANYRAHYEGTGPEIWEQTGGHVDAFVAAAGTGGTVAGVSRFLQEKNPNVRCFLIDPPGSGLFNKVTRGVMYTKEEAEGRRLKNPFDTITEGIGINRLTQNFLMAKLDGAFRGTDREAVEMSRYLLKNDGLFLGSSSAMNCVGAVRVARSIGPGKTIVTILCDSGMRHLSKFFSAEYLSHYDLMPKATGLEFL